MAYRQVQLLAVFAAVACLASVASATVYIVGDGDRNGAWGWRPNFTATHWADDKTFVVGDSLVFIYYDDTHTVAQVGEDDFAACNVTGNFISGPTSIGHETVPLLKPGKMWFICTKPDHCLNGMKLAIDVVEAAGGPTQQSSPAPGSYAVAGALAAAGAVAVAAAVLAF